MKLLGVVSFLGLIVGGAGVVSVAAVSPEEVAGWREDLRFVQERMPSVHPDLFHNLPRAVFDASIDTLVARLPTLSHHEIIAELAAIVASVGDGHTRVTLPMVAGSGFFEGHSPTPPPTSAAMMFHFLPIRLAIDDDGIFVQAIDRTHTACLGARVERIGRMSAADAMQRVSRVAHHDNAMQLRSVLPSRLVIPELLAALGVADDPDRTAFALSPRTGPPCTLVLEAVPESSTVDWVDAGSISGGRPSYLAHSDRNYWFEFQEPRNLVYCQYNEVADAGDESIAAFCSRMTAFLAEHAVGVLVLDLRFNRGGDNSLNRSFLHALMCCPGIQEPGRFFVIIGRDTFSAALMFALDLEKYTQAIFVGEPTGGRPNHFGDSRKIQLPYSGVTLRVSTLYWQYGGPKDDRPWLPPHVPVGFRSEDAWQGRDPVLERIAALVAASAARTPAGQWSGRFLGYDARIEIHAADGGWKATMDFPGEGATGLPLTGVRYRDSILQFDFPNGDETIAFQGTIHDDTIIGRMSYAGQVYPWVMTLAE